MLKTVVVEFTNKIEKMVTTMDTLILHDPNLQNKLGKVKEWLPCGKDLLVNAQRIKKIKLWKDEDKHE